MKYMNILCLLKLFRRVSYFGYHSYAISSRGQAHVTWYWHKRPFKVNMFEAVDTYTWF